MPTPSAASAREILTGLHEVMASRLGAQAKLNKVVEIIGEAMESEVCSIYLLRDGMLELSPRAASTRARSTSPSSALGEGLVGTIAQNVETLNLAEATEHPNSPTAPKPARRSSTASPACRSCGASGRSACSPSSMPIRAATTMSRSRRCRRWRWCSPS